MKSTILVCLVVISSLVYSKSACASTLYASSASPPLAGGGHLFYSVDQSTAASTTISSNTFSDDLASDWRQDSYRIWAIYSGNQLLKVDPVTGNETFLAFTSETIAAIAFDVTTNTLFGVGVSRGNFLCRIDPNTGAVTVIGNTSFSGYTGLAADLGGNLFAVNGGNTLIHLNPITGHGQAVGTVDSGIVDLAVRPEDGTMFGIRNLTVASKAAYSLFTIDTATAATVTVNVPRLNQTMSRMAFSPAVPEPSVFALTAILSTLVCLLRSRSRRESRVVIMLLSGCATVCYSALPVRASTLYGTLQSSSQVGSNFCSINQDTGAATAIFGNAIADDLASDWRPESARMWGLLFGDELVQINPATGSQTLIGVMSEAFGGLAFDVTTGSLYGVGGVRGFSLYRIDPNTAAVTVVGSTTFRNYVGLGADLNGNLFGVTSDNNLIRINTATGVGELVGKTAAEIEDLAVRPEDGAMFGATNIFGSNMPPSYSLLRIDKATAAAMEVGDFQINKSLYGLAFSPSVPEPSTLFLAAIVAGFPRRSFRSSCRTRKAKGYSRARKSFEYSIGN
jgi:hypothetical protein